jgi:hypothetical protein
MIRNNLWARIFFLALCTVNFPRFSLADYIVGTYTYYGGVYRINDFGGTMTDYIAPLPQSLKQDIEAYGAGVAVTPDRSKVYSLVNSLGFSNYVLASNVSTGQYLSSDTLTPSSNYSNLGPDYLNQAKEPLLTSSELFVLSELYESGPGNHWQVKRFNLSTHALLQTIDPPTPQHIEDIALNPTASRLYVASADGIYSYSKSGSNYSTSPTLIVPGVDGKLAYGPDGQLYVKNLANGDVQRFTTVGAFVDTFISHVAFPNLGTMEFGADGNLHIFQDIVSSDYDRILTFGSNGALLYSTQTYAPYGGPFTSFTYLPALAPEPCGLAMLCTAAAACVTVRRPKRR